MVTAIIPILSLLSPFSQRASVWLAGALSTGRQRQSRLKALLDQRRTKGSQQCGPSHVSFCARDLSRDETVNPQRTKGPSVERLTRGGAPFPGDVHHMAIHHISTSRAGVGAARWGRRARLWLVARIFWAPGLDPSTLACDDCLPGRG